MLSRLLAALLLLLPTTVVAQERPVPGEPAVLIDNVNGVTVESGRILHFTGLVIDKDGRVVARLAKDARRPARVAVVDGRGATLLPGFMDAHVHVMGLGETLMQLDLSDTTSLADAQARIKDYAARQAGGGWILGRGWNQEKWGLGRFPTAADLDSIAGEVPVYLERVDGHAGWANTAAMRAAGITAATKAPEGGRIERDAKGQPTGLFVDRATDLITAKAPAPVPVELNRAFRLAQEALIARGITAVADMGTTAADWLTIRRAADAGELRIRIVSYAAGLPTALEVAGTGPTPWLYGDRLRMVGVKLYTDGALGSRGAWLKRPYADAPGQTGLPFLSETELRNQMSRAAMDRFQLAIHAIGDRANAQVLDAIEELVPTYSGDRRWRIEHAQVIDPADVTRFGPGIVVSVQPTHQTSDRLMAEARLGPDRLAGAYAWSSLASAGAHLALGSDTPVERPDVLAGLATAITRQDADGQPPGGWLPQERLTRAQAIDGFTNGAAYAAFADDRWGRLAPGQWADFVLLDTDPATASAEAIRRATVRQVWIAGRPMGELKP